MVIMFLHLGFYTNIVFAGLLLSYWCVVPRVSVMESVSVLVDVTTLKMARKPVKLQKENPAGCAGEDKQSKGN